VQPRSEHTCIDLHREGIPTDTHQLDQLPHNDAITFGEALCKVGSLMDDVGHLFGRRPQTRHSHIRSIKIENTGGDDHDDCRLDLTLSPAFLRPKTWTIDRLVVMRLSVSLRLSP
jgi:hypothetical protein